jgi:hypothetical protein
MLGFNGGLLGVRKVPTGASASGLWFQNEQSVARRAGIWPRTDAYRYYRLSNFASTSLESNTIDFGEIELYDGATKHTGITCTTSWTFDSGNASSLVDGYQDGTNRAYYSSWSSVRATATITFDLGSTKPLTHIKIFSLYTQPRFPESFDIQGSSDGSGYAAFASVTVGSLSLVDGVTYASDKIAV